MTNKVIFDISLDELVFEHRNKAYGAYMLRKNYDEHMMKAFLSACAFFVMIVCSPYVIQALKGQSVVELCDYLGPEVIIYDFNHEVAHPVPPPEAAQAKHAAAELTGLLDYKVKPDDQATIETVVPTQESLIDKIIGPSTTTGDPGGSDPSLGSSGNGGVEAAFTPVIELPEEVHKYVSEMPSFPDGEAALFRYIADHVRYPALARENSIEGRVVISFIISKTGAIEQVKVVRGIGGGCDEEAARVIQNMPHWKAGKHNGRAVAVSYTIPVSFQLIH